MTLTETDAERIARRYPKPSSRALWKPIAAVFGAALLTWTVWAGVHGANPEVAAHVAGFKVVSDAQMDVQVTVQRRDVNSRVECTVKALAVSYDTVGELRFTWEPNGQELQQQWVSVRTFKEATAAEMGACKVVG